MAGNKEGGKKTAITNKIKYGEDYYSKIGAAGGRAGHTGGFYQNVALAKKAGAKGGRKSRSSYCSDEVFTMIWNKYEGDVNKVATELGYKPTSAYQRYLRLKSKQPKRRFNLKRIFQFEV